MIDPRINITPPGFDPARDLPGGFMDFFLPLQRRYQAEVVKHPRPKLRRNPSDSLNCGINMRCQRAGFFHQRFKVTR